MEELIVIVAENGFIVNERGGYRDSGKSWAFESSEALAKFMKEWGNAKFIEKQKNGELKK